MKNGTGWVGFLFFLVLGLVQACSSSDNGGSAFNLPKLTPPVQSSAPQVFGGTATQSLRTFTESYSSQISASDFATRFFQSGPTDIYQILQAIDSRISGINSSSNKPACATQAPVQYTITPLGQSVTMYAQCYQTVTAGSASNQFVQWGG